MCMKHEPLDQTTPMREEGLSGQLLIAMPGMPDRRFAKSVIYMCAHNEEGAMGLVINQGIENLSFEDLLDQMNIDHDFRAIGVPIHFGGPVEAGRGFVLHTPDYRKDGTMVVDDHVAVTATVDILKAIAEGHGPTRRLLVLGYAGWGPGQLDDEIKANGWLNVEADEELVFGPDLNDKWRRAMEKIGVDPRMLSDNAGNA